MFEKMEEGCIKDVDNGVGVVGASVCTAVFITCGNSHRGHFRGFRGGYGSRLGGRLGGGLRRWQRRGLRSGRGSAEDDASRDGSAASADSHVVTGLLQVVVVALASCWYRVGDARAQSIHSVAATIVVIGHLGSRAVMQGKHLVARAVGLI